MLGSYDRWRLQSDPDYGPSDRAACLECGAETWACDFPICDECAAIAAHLASDVETLSAASQDCDRGGVK